MPAPKNKRLTREDLAYMTADSARLIMQQTNSPEDWLLAREAWDYASAAGSHYANARQFDRDTGGGSNVAWSCRNQGRRDMAKADKAMAGIKDRLGETWVWDEPSLSDLLAMLEIEVDAPPALMVDYDRYERTRIMGLTTILSPDIKPVRVLTEKGRAALERYRDKAVAFRQLITGKKEAA